MLFTIRRSFLASCTRRIEAREQWPQVQSRKRSRFIPVRQGRRVLYGQKMDDIIRFEWFDASTNKTVALKENFTFNPDLVIGSSATPQLLNVVELVNVDKSILVYPNPFVNFVVLKLYPMHNVSKATIFDMLGHAIQNIEIKSTQNEIKIEMQNAPSGSYIISLFDESGSTIDTQQLLKK